MTMHLAMTAAGLAAIADADNVGTSAVKFTRLAVGAGTASGDQSARTALIDQKEIAAVTGQASGSTRIAIRADFMPGESFAVTEAGLMAQIGEGAEFLAAYWAASSTAGALASAAADTTLVVAGVIAIESSSAAISVTPSLNISVGVPDNVVLKTDHASETQRGIVELATTAEARAGTDRVRAVTPAGLESRIDDIPTAAAPPNASTTRKGIVELATAAEAQAGTDRTRAVTPSALAGRTATATRRGIVELATATEAAAGTDAERAVTPAGLKAVVDGVGGGIAGAADAKTGTSTVVAGDDGKILEANASAAAFTITLPNLGSDDDGFTVTVIKTDSSANVVTVAGDGDDRINGAATYKLEGRWEGVILKWTGAVWIAIGGASTSWLAAQAASTTRRGIVELATATEAAAGTDAERAVTPKNIVPAIAAHIRQRITVRFEKLGSSPWIRVHQDFDLPATISSVDMEAEFGTQVLVTAHLAYPPSAATKIDLSQAFANWTYVDGADVLRAVISHSSFGQRLNGTISCDLDPYFS